MNKEVLLSISGIQFDIDQNEEVELVTIGNYYKKNDSHFILYEENVEEENEFTKNRIKFNGKKLEVTKKGANNVHMIFEENKTNYTYYDTLIGTLLIGIYTSSIQVKEEKEQMRIFVKYSLEINSTHISDCKIEINVRSKHSGVAK